MLYPLKFKPIYKDYIWGGRNLLKYKKDLPDWSIAESWEISCCPDGESIIDNGIYKGLTLNQLINIYSRGVVGSSLPVRYVEKFPLLIKMIDANDRLSIQVHPNDVYARRNDNSDYGKNEMWYILEAKPGSKIIYGMKLGTTKEDFVKAIKEGTLLEHVNEIEVVSGDTINIPAGVIHAIGEGIVLVEVQQNSNITYRVYDYDRVDKYGNKRELHIDKAIDVIEFGKNRTLDKIKGFDININEGVKKTYLVSNKYFSVEKYNVKGKIYENANGSKFLIYVIIDGECEIDYKSGKINLVAGESILVPAYTGCFILKGKFNALKTYVPNIQNDIVNSLRN